MIFVAAPFGNYIKPKGTIPVCGTFTLHARGTDFSGVYEYLKEGADHVSLGSVCFNPLALRKILKKIEL
jgi:hypothetical protein